MKPKVLCAVFSAEAVLCAVLASLTGAGGGLSAGIMSFPFEQIGFVLRALSLSSAAGNTAAVIIYCALSLAPSAYFVVRAKRQRARAEDSLLFLLSVLLFVTLNMMINPAYIARHFGASELIPMGKVMLGATVYAAAAGYVILRALRAFERGGAESILKHLSVLLLAICAVMVYAIAGAGTVALTDALRQLRDGNQGSGGLSLSYFFVILQFVVDRLPYVLNIVIIFSGFGLIEALKRGQYGDTVVPMARATARLCRIAIAAIMLSQVAVNTLQLMLGSSIRAGNYTLSIPLDSIAFVLAAMLLAHYFEQARALKDDNDMII